jgi:protein SCO1
MGSLFQLRKVIVGTVLFACLGFSAGCGPSRSAEQNTPAATQAKDAGTKRYPLTGRVVSVDKSAQTMNVDGDAIPGFMAAMTMPYQVKDSSVLEKLSAGDQIKADIVVGNDEAHLENIVVTGKAPSPKLPK